MSASKQIAVIVGASRGIGLELARIYLAQSNIHLVALSRDGDAARKAILDTAHAAPLHVERNGSNAGEQDLSKALDESRLTTISVDVREEDSIHSASEEVRKTFGGDSLRLLLNVSGVLNVEKNIGQVKYDEMLNQFKINTFAPLLTAKHFSPLLVKKVPGDDASQGLLPKDFSVVASLSARVGSIEDNKKGGWYSYRASKAAQNQITRSLAHEFTMRKVPAICVGLHPGTVRTDLSRQFTGGPGGTHKPGQKEESDEDRRARGEFEANESAQMLASVVAHLKAEQNAQVWDYANKRVPF